jgi:hypothetical protein
MANFNDEMKALANYAIRAAKEKFGQELDFSGQSIDKLENLLELAYQSFFYIPKDEKTRNAISRTANIWGSYLGEFMRLKWGGTWIEKDSERFVYINNREFSPISYIYQRITNHPENSVEKYLTEAERKIFPSQVISPQSQNLFENNNRLEGAKINNQSNNIVRIDKNLIYILASIGGVLLVIVACVIGYMIRITSGMLAPNLIPHPTLSVSLALTSTLDPIPSPTITSTPISTPTLIPTAVIFSDPKDNLPTESEMPRNFNLVTNNVVSFSGTIPINLDLKAYTVAYENWNETISGEPLYVAYAGFLVPNETLAQKTYEFWCNSANLDELFISIFPPNDLIKYGEITELNSKITDTDQSVIFARTVDNLLYDNYQNYAKTYFACYRLKNFVGITYTLIYHPDIEYSTTQIEYFASLSTDKLLMGK